MTRRSTLAAPCCGRAVAAASLAAACRMAAAGGATCNTWRTTSWKAATPAAPVIAKPPLTWPANSNAPGSKPAGTEGYIQPVRFHTRRLKETESSLTLVRNGESEELVLGEDAIIGTRIDPAPSVDAEVVFAGYALTVPEMQYDDLAGLDLRGKIVLYITRRPGEHPGAAALALSIRPTSAASFWNAPASSERSAFRTRITWICRGSGSRWAAGRHP